MESRASGDKSTIGENKDLVVSESHDRFVGRKRGKSPNKETTALNPNSERWVLGIKLKKKKKNNQAKLDNFEAKPALGTFVVDL